MTVLDEFTKAKWANLTFWPALIIFSSFLANYSAISIIETISFSFIILILLCLTILLTSYFLFEELSAGSSTILLMSYTLILATLSLTLNPNDVLVPLLIILIVNWITIFVIKLLKF